MSRCDIDVNKYILASLHHKWLVFCWSQILALYIGAYRTACIARYGKSQSQDKYLQTYYIVNQGPCNGADWMPADKLTETSWIKLKEFEINSPPLWSASVQPTRLHCLLAFVTGSGDIHVCCCEFRCIHTCLLLLILMLWYRQAISESKVDKSSSPLNAVFEDGKCVTPNR